MTHAIEITTEPTEADRDAILKPLVAYNAEHAGKGDYGELALLVRDAAGEIVGGLYARSVYDWMFVELLVVPEALRGQGVGSELMARAEDAARTRGCAGIWLDTFSFQARPFYERLGYALFGSLPDHPRGHSRYFLSKLLG